MPYQTTITRKGQITVPKPLREFLKLKESSRVILEIEKKERVIKMRPALTILDLAGKFKPKKVESALKIRRKMAKLYRRE